MCCSTLIRIWLMIALIQTSKQSAYNGCNYRPPDSYGDCGYSCIEQISRWQFQDLANAMPNCNSFSFYLSHGHYHSFAEKFFSLVGKVHHFFLEITNVTFSHFPNSLGSVSPFSGVVFDVSIYLQLVNIDVRNDWNWKAFEDLKPVKGGTGVFEGYGINMTHLGNGFSHVLHGHLRRIRFSGGNLKTLDDDVFTGLYCLTEVLLHDNQIQEIKRNYFPSPATVLELLVLRICALTIMYSLALLILLFTTNFVDSARSIDKNKMSSRQAKSIEREDDAVSANNPLNVDDYETPRINECDCNWSSRRCGCECFGALSYETLNSLATNFQNCEMFRFKVTYGSFYSLPPNFFTGVGKVKDFSIEIYDSICDYFLDPEPDTSPFRGVSFENKAFIKLSNVMALRSWNWSPLRELESLSGNGVDIDIDGYGIRKLSSDFSRIASGSVKNVKISSSNLEMIGGGSFSSFENITRMLLPDNRIRALSRSILPETASKLEEIDLQRNSLYSLEPDMFTDMPVLRKLSLNGNPIRVIGEGTFKPILQTTRIDGISSFPLVCDCRIQWLKDAASNDNPKTEENLKGAICKRPPHLRGTPLRDLSPEHLICR